VSLAAEAAARQPPDRFEPTHAAVLRIALPMTLGQISVPLLGLADTAVIGRLGAAHLLGGVVVGATIFDVLFWAFGFLRIGTVALTAQALGARDPDEQRATLARALLLAAGLGVVVVLLQRPIAAFALAAMGASDLVSGAARAYFDLRIWSAPFVFANYALFGAIVGRARTDVALALQVLINLTNIGLNVGFVYGLGLGVRGSALGTLIAEAVMTVACLATVRKLGGPIFRLPRHHLLDRAALWRLVAINRDIMIRTLGLLFCYSFFSAQGARGGDVMLAANAILLNLSLFTSFFLDGYGTAAEQMCGRAFGARDEAAFRKTVRLVLGWGCGTAALLAVVVLAVGDDFVAFVTTNEAVRATAHAMLLFAALSPLAGVLAFSFDGIFSGATWTRDMRNLMLVVVVLYLGVFLATRSLGNVGLWLSMLTFLGSRGLLQLWRYPTLVARSFG
jgi:MATE family multidrug resistance protein